MAGKLKDLVKLREELKKRIPSFKRVNASRYATKLGEKWRKQRGRHNKIRKAIKGAGAKVSVGYGSLRDARHLHPAGYEEILVTNLKDLEKVADPSKQAIRIASSVGLRKRLEILRRAKEKNIHVLNARIISRVKKKGYSSLSDLLGAIGKKAKITAGQTSSEKKAEEDKNKDDTLDTKNEKNKERASQGGAKKTSKKSTSRSKSKKSTNKK